MDEIGSGTSQCKVYAGDLRRVVTGFGFACNCSWRVFAWTVRMVSELALTASLSDRELLANKISVA